MHNRGKKRDRTQRLHCRNDTIRTEKEEEEKKKKKNI